MQIIEEKKKQLIKLFSFNLESKIIFIVSNIKED